MTALLALLEPADFVILGGIVLILGFITAFSARQNVDLRRVESRLNDLQARIDALLRHHQLEIPSTPASVVSEEVARLAALPESRIAAIKRYREQNPGVGLAEAKARIEALAGGRSR